MPRNPHQTEDLVASGDGLLATTTKLNQLGEAYSVQRGDVTSQHLSTAVPVTSDTFTYVADSNPFFSTSDATMGWIRKKFDQNGRLQATDYFSGPGAPSPWGSNSLTTGGQTVSYLNNTTTFADEASKSRKQTVDGLGRLTSVIEDPGGLNYTTNYTYDFGDRLTNVVQTDSVEGAQSRTFVYDSAGRLTSATNPETGLISYQYDGNGNVTQRSDPRVTTNFTYDAGNRIKTKTYSGDPTPPVTYCYDALPTSPGVCATGFVVGSGFVDRQTEVYSSASRTDYLTFDGLGRVKSSQQVTGTVTPGTFAYTYTPQGALKTEQYPSGRTITYSLDPVAGRVTTVASGGLNYASNIGYWANGSTKQMNLGNTLVEQSCLNTRMEPLVIRLGTATSPDCANSSDTLNLSYTYASSDNGNVLSQTINRPGFSATQSYTLTPYDGVNRLKKVQETGPGTTWFESYSYDAFGNRWVTNPTPPTVETPIAQSWYTSGSSPTGCPPWRANQINGWCYDTSGNVTSITGMQRTFAYDAENRQKTATINTTPIAYVYDGDGRRVQKVICPVGTANCTATVSGAVTTTFVYDAQGQLASEYGPASDNGTRYVTADHLGSTRALTDVNGFVTKCYDYYPFGGEIPVGVDNRPSCYGAAAYPAAPDLISEKFTGKERDAETGLDFFGARYMSGAQGRFTSPDPSNLSVDFWLPQTWNRYSYVLNNPLNMADRNGLWPFYIHNEIINEAFPGMSKQDLQILKEASAGMDTRPGQQSGGQAPQHGMSNGSSGQTTAQAQQQGDAFIAEQEDLARQIQADWLASGQSGISPYALMAFGNALHTIEDRLSPAHIGSQPWYGQSAWSPSAWAHFLHESYITSFQMGLATSGAQRAFRNTFGFDAFTLMQLQQQQPPPPQKPTVTTKICYTLDNGTQICQ